MAEEHKASRTIVKSPPELWAECSVAQSLARHLGQFGEIKITRLEPETTVAWEGEHASGTVRLEPSGWGTQVTLTATPVPVVVPEPEVVAVVEPEDVPRAEVAPELEESDDAEQEAEDESENLPRWQVFARIWARLSRKSHDAEPDEVDEDDEEEAAADEDGRGAFEPAPDLAAAAPEAPDAEGEPVDPGSAEETVNPDYDLDHQALLVGALESLGRAHHRPFSRA